MYQKKKGATAQRPSAAPLRVATLEDPMAAVHTGAYMNGTPRIEQCTAWVAVDGAPADACPKGFSLEWT